MSEMVGDIDINVTYAAVGRALSRWETVELALARIYALFVARSLALDKIREYGAQNRIFIERLFSLKRASVPYFRNNPDQTNEGDFFRLCQRAETLSTVSNYIAHGIVSEVHYFITADTLPSEYPAEPILCVLQTPWYESGRKMQIGPDGIGSAEILDASEPFKLLRIDADAFVHRLLPP